MFNNYLTTAFRNLLRNKVFSLINISGLAVGIGCCLLIALFVHDELSYDKYHANADRIYRVIREWNLPNGKVNVVSTSAHDALALLNDYPDVVVNAVRFKPLRHKSIISHGDKHFSVDHFSYTDPSVFDIFSLELVQGDPKTALLHPNTIIISETIARKHFDNRNPVLGKILSMDNGESFKVTGILEDLPRNSHFHFDYLASFSSLDKNRLGDWGSGNFVTYILLQDGYLSSELEKAFPSLIKKYLDNERGPMLKLHLQRLTDIHLHSHLVGEWEPNSDISHIYIFSVAAFSVLLIACINHINLSTARSVNRAREVGVRKVVGAHRIQLIKQFMGESILHSIIALILSVILVELSMPWFHTFVDIHTGLYHLLLEGVFPILLLGVVLFVGFGSGSYPAFWLSSLQPVETINRTFRRSWKTSVFRKHLVIFQFSLSIILMIITQFVYSQLDYMKTRPLGFDAEQVVILPINTFLSKHFEAINREFLQNSNVINVTASMGLPGNFISKSGVKLEDSQDQIWAASLIGVDHSFIKTFGMEIIEGRDFSKELKSDLASSFIINETAARQFGWDNPIGKNITWLSKRKHGVVVGVVKDFHFASLHEPIEPLIFSLHPYYTNISVKIKAAGAPLTLNFLENAFHKVIPNYPFDFFFVKDSYGRLYKTEEKLGRILGSFSVLAIFVACLGLFGLASFMVEQRVKEIGIRKVLGASVRKIMILLSKDIVRLVLWAILIACPVAYLSAHRWLQMYAYRIEIGIGEFILGSTVALAIVLATVVVLIAKAAMANPMDTLKTE